jgi:hypothetical protein
VLDAVLRAQIANLFEKGGSHRAFARLRVPRDNLHDKRAPRLERVPNRDPHQGQNDDGEEPVGLHGRIGNEGTPIDTTTGNNWEPSHGKAAIVIAF